MRRADISESDSRFYCKAFKLQDGNEIAENQEVKFFDKKYEEDVNWREWFEVAKKHQKLHQRTSNSQDEATVELPVKDNKTAIMFSACWHLGRSQ